MVKKKRGRGALGVDVLLSAAETESAISGDITASKALQNIPVDLIHQSPYQPRQIMEPEALEA